MFRKDIYNFSDLKLKILYYCKMPKTLMEISRQFDKSYWYIDHIIGELKYDGLITTLKRGRNIIILTPIEMAIAVEKEMRRRYEFQLLAVPTA